MEVVEETARRLDGYFQCRYRRHRAGYDHHQLGSQLDLQPRD